MVAPTPRGEALVVLVERARGLPEAERARLRDWLAVRTGVGRVWVVDVAPEEVPPPPEAGESAAPPGTPTEPPGVTPSGRALP